MFIQQTKNNQMISKYISIKDVVARYEISTSKARKIVNQYKDTKHVQTSKINGRHGFKYQISIEFLDELLKVAPDKQAPTLAEFDNTLLIQLQTTNNQLSNQIDTQNDIIKNLTTTLQEQQKVVIAQSLQISRLSERTTTEQWNNPSDQGPTTTKKTTTIELLIIVVLLICIVAAIAYLFISIVN